ncbi:hypothetical protein OXPF_41980 [Oxobacter pfennigii]|uniref:Uncharacterized protein n=1 Tax=Oxobacter pfennigii TaxID=36849 RepID=A0A0P8W4K0_9CLOT|nr:hypothetical protein [Oxobacter pfennigii]KPU42413.1 hypothetical protein OXPF_41980 [Oxobacter pfennigii]
MRRHEKNRLFLSIIAILYILKTPFLNTGFDVLKTHPESRADCAYTFSRNVSFIDLYTPSEKTCVHHKTTAIYNGIKSEYAVLVLILKFIALYITVYVAKKLMELNAVRFNGSKYKGGYSLPEF